MAEKRKKLSPHQDFRLNVNGHSDSPSILDISEDFLTEQQGCQELVSSWKILMSDEEIQLCVDRVARHLNNTFRNSKKPVVLTAILKGVYVFLSDLSKRLTFPYSVYFLEASSYGHGQQQQQVQLLSQIDPKKFIDRQVVLLDELFDNGTTLHSIKDLLLQNQALKLTPADIYTCTLFTKKSGTTLPPPDLVGIADLPPLWLVGFGLDDQGEKRGWPHLFACPKIEGVPKEPEDDIFLDGEGGLKALVQVRNAIVSSLAAIEKELKTPA